MVCLNSKTYCTAHQDTAALKFAMKETNKTLESPPSKYISVLETKIPYEGVNRDLELMMET